MYQERGCVDLLFDLYLPYKFLSFKEARDRQVLGFFYYCSALSGGAFFW
jgi:hypothetical protein